METRKNKEIGSSLSFKDVKKCMCDEMKLNEIRHSQRYGFII